MSTCPNCYERITSDEERDDLYAQLDDLRAQLRAAEDSVDSQRTANHHLRIENADLVEGAEQLQGKLALMRGQVADLLANADADQATLTQAIRDRAAAEAERDAMREALERIASCESHHPSDVVAIARATLSQSPDRAAAETALKLAVGLIAANRLVLGEYSGIRDVADVEAACRAALSRSTASGGYDHRTVRAIVARIRDEASEADPEIPYPTPLEIAAFIEREFAAPTPSREGE